MLRTEPVKIEDDKLNITATASDKSSDSSFSSFSSLDGFAYPLTSAKQAWSAYKDLEINASLFARGIIAIRAASSIFPPQPSETDGNYFSMSSRTLFFGKNNNRRETRKARDLLQKLEVFCKAPPCKMEDTQTILFNEKRREELFFPFSLPDSQQRKIGFYLYPWLSSGDQNLIFGGFKQFVFASCILGSSLKGVDQNRGLIELIKHDIEFHPFQKIVEIDVNLSSFSAYETASFSELKKLTFLMRQLSKKDEAVQLYYHLPYLDYMLFGVSLFIRGRITLKALNDFFRAILIRKEEYIQELEKIFHQQGISLQVASPFENLFGILPKPSDHEQYATLILNKLNIPAAEIKPTVDQEEIQTNEKVLVQYCLQLLKINHYHPEQREAWENFSNLQQDGINNLEILFKLANTIMIALATQGRNPYETCSLLPLSEKQIQVNFQQLNKTLHQPYPAVFNITTLDPVIAYEPGNPGLLFYFRNCQESLKKLIVKKDILSAAHENISHYTENEESVTLETVLKRGKFA